MVAVTFARGETDEKCLRVERGGKKVDGIVKGGLEKRGALVQRKCRGGILPTFAYKLCLTENKRWLSV